MTRTEALAAIQALPFVEAASLWTKVAGKERIYIELKRYNRDGTVFGGFGGKVYIDLTTGKVIKDYRGYADTQYFNSYTLAAHTEMGSTAKLKEIALAIVA
jgi:hypothetical protein